MKATLLRVSGSTVALAASLVLGGGMASAQTISTTGPGSTNIISDTNRCDFTVDNSNDVDVTTNNPQNSGSGSVSAGGNTTVGGVSSGTAENDSSNSVDIGVTNSVPDLLGGGTCLPGTTLTPQQPGQPQQPSQPSQPVTTTTTTAPTPTPSGGRGGGQQQVAAPSMQQVAAPVGGVGAGMGGLGYLATLASITGGSILWFILRFRRMLGELFQ